MALSYQSLPPQIQQMLMQRFGVKTPADAQMLMQRLQSDPEELASVLQSLGIDASAEDAVELQEQAQDWIDNAASEQAGEPPPRTPDDDPGDYDDGEGDAEDTGDAPDEGETQSDDDEVEEGEGSPPQAAVSGASGSSDMQPANASSAASSQVQNLLRAATAGRGVGPRGAQGGDMEAAITELVSRGRQGGGAPPQGRNFKAPRMQMPHSKADVASKDPRMQKMIADIYRTTSNQSSGPERAYQPSGDRS